MDRQTITFAVTTCGKEISQIGRSVIYQPKIRYEGKGTKWFDDPQLTGEDGVL